MGNSLVACFNGVRDVEVVEARKPKDPKVSKCINRDELNEKKPYGRLYCFPGEEEGGHVDARRSSGDLVVKGVTRVKIVLTKQEAALMLSNCKGGEGVLQNIVSELERMETSRVTVVPPPISFCGSWKPTLESIPEEFF